MLLHGGLQMAAAPDEAGQAAGQNPSMGGGQAGPGLARRDGLREDQRDFVLRGVAGGPPGVAGIEPGVPDGLIVRHAGLWKISGHADRPPEFSETPGADSSRFLDPA